MRCGCPGQAFEQRLYGNEDEGQQDALRLGEVERALERGLRQALVAELLAGQRVEQLRLGGRGRPVKHRSRTVEHAARARRSQARGHLRRDG